MSSVGKEFTCNAGDPGLIPGSGRSPGEGIRLLIPVFLGFPCGSAGKESTCNLGDLGLIPGLGRSLGEGNGCSGLENSMACPWGRKELDTAEQLSQTNYRYISEKINHEVKGSMQPKVQCTIILQ